MSFELLSQLFPRTAIEEMGHKVFEGLVGDEERHFNQYDLELEKINQFGAQYLALQSVEGNKGIPGGTSEA